tara:strand:- start:1331 stop:1678 length:348 start_codon:yes stop_codon:yes gene_type:complete
MKFVKLLKYVEKAYEGKPSFLILMNDNKEYISNSCVFVENTKENRRVLAEEHNCQYHLDELLKSGDCDMSSVIDARGMFAFSRLTEFNSDMSSVTDDSYVFYGTPYERNIHQGDA